MCDSPYNAEHDHDIVDLGDAFAGAWEDTLEAGETLPGEIVAPAPLSSARRVTAPWQGEIERESVGTISSVDYIKWVQRSLNRRYGLGIPTDGKTSSAYRSAVRRFNLDYTGRDYADVDEQTQNQLIYVSEVHPGYVRWVILALNAVGLGPLPYTDTYTTAVTSAIKAFQRRVALKPDGYVGSKTELALIKAIGKVPPGQAEPRTPGPADTTDWPAFLQTKLRQSREYMEENSALWEDTLSYCIIRTLLRGDADDRVILPDRMTRFFAQADDGGYPDISHLKRILIDQDLKKGLGRGNIEKFVSRVDDIHRVNVVNALGVLTRQKKWSGYEERVPRTVRLLKKWSGNANSVYHCPFLRKIIDDLASDHNIW